MALANSPSSTVHVAHSPGLLVNSTSGKYTVPPSTIPVGPPSHVASPFTSSSLAQHLTLLPPANTTLPLLLPNTPSNTPSFMPANSAAPRASLPDRKSNLISSFPSHSIPKYRTASNSLARTHTALTPPLPTSHCTVASHSTISLNATCREVSAVQ